MENKQKELIKKLKKDEERLSELKMRNLKKMYLLLKEKIRSWSVNSNGNQQRH